MCVSDLKDQGLPSHDITVISLELDKHQAHAPVTITMFSTLIAMNTCLIKRVFIYSDCS